MEPYMAESPEALERLLSIVRRLRGPEGCSWDRKQTVRSLRPFMLEEAYEVADATEGDDPDRLRSELGDLLLHIVMSSVICEEQGLFDLAGVMRGISEKLVRRHPHVFGEGEELSPEEVERQWEAIKAGEKEEEEEGFFGSMPSGMPSLQTAWRIQQRASEVGFDWPDVSGALEKAHEELGELREELGTGDREAQVHELGDLLFSVVNCCRLLGVEPESALRATNDRFRERFGAMERILREEGASLRGAGLERMERAWQLAKSGAADGASPDRR